MVISQTSLGKAVAPRLSVKLQAGIVPGAVALPDTSNGFVVKKGAFSGKAFAYVKVDTDVKIIGLVPNAFGHIKGEGSAAVENTTANIPASGVKVLRSKPCYRR
jgi:electron transfer flavoprotein alpha subunit